MPRKKIKKQEPGCRELRVLLKLLKADGLNAGEFAQLLSVPPLKLSRWKLGRTQTPNEFKTFCRVLIQLHQEEFDIVELLNDGNALSLKKFP